MDNSSKDNSVTAGDVQPSDIAMYYEGEKVLAHHVSRYYEAKVLMPEIRNKEWKYFVHYVGWSKKWDEWVPECHLKKYTEENVRKHLAQHQKESAEKTTKSGRSTQGKAKKSTDAKVDKEDIKSNVSKVKKRKNDSGAEKGSVTIEKFVRIQIPVTLKKQLVDDWDFVTQQDKTGKATSSIVKQLWIMHLHQPYGAEHLLCLFVKLPELLAYVNIEEETSTRLQQKLLDFLKFLQKNQGTFFLSAYDGTKVSEGKGKGNDE